MNERIARSRIGIMRDRQTLTVLSGLPQVISYEDMEAISKRNGESVEIGLRK
jgi:hypothetical protein